MSDFAVVCHVVRSRKPVITARARRFLGALVVVAGVLGLSTPAAASPLLVGYGSSGFGPITFGADIFSMTGASGILQLDDEFETTRTINTAVFTIGNSGSLSATRNLVLSQTLTLAGVTHTLTQSATWVITPALDTFVAVEASAPVLFDTAVGDWLVTLNGFSFSGSTLGTQSRGVTADFTATTPVPEPASILLFGTAALGVLANLRRRQRQVR